MVKEAFSGAADALAARDPITAAVLRRASTHWLRHTAASHQAPQPTQTPAPTSYGSSCECHAGLVLFDRYPCECITLQSGAGNKGALSAYRRSPWNWL
jgi:hypothetical protein